MSDDLVKRAREALDGVTPGPWKHVDKFGVDSTAPHGYVANAGFGYDGEPDEEPEANARFIAASRELVPTMADRIEELEANLAKAVEGLMQIERIYYQEATNPSPETIRRMSARMNGIAYAAIAEINGGGDE